MPYTNGIYSPFGDVAKLWTSSLNDNYFTLYNFATGSSELLEDADSRAYVRCVWAENEPASAPAQEFPQKIGNRMWSEMSGYITSLEDANAYCSSLGEGWELPSIMDLVADLVNTDYCGNYEDLMSETPEGRCDRYSFEGYSVFGDMVKLISGTENGWQQYMFDFVTGEPVSAYSIYGYVRCVRSLEV